MKQLLIKPEKCIGCRTCELVCSFGHYGHFNPKLANVKVFEYEQTAVAILIMCLQCEDPSCLKVCPVRAISRDENGAVVMNPDKCIGCKMCTKVCPRDAILPIATAEEKEKYKAIKKAQAEKAKAAAEAAAEK